VKNSTFYSLSISFLCGVALFTHVSAPRTLLAVCAVFFCVGATLVQVTKRFRYVLLPCCLVSIFCLGALRVEYTKFQTHTLDVVVGTSFTVEGSICDEPQIKTTTQTLCFLPDTTADKILISTYPYPRYDYGDRLAITGKLSVPKNFVAYEGGPEFNYVAYLAKDGVRYTMFQPKIHRLQQATYSLQKSLFAIKQALTTKAEELLPEPESSLLGGILLGDKQGLSKETTGYFKNAGLIHILVLSGYNVTIVAESFMKLFSFLPRMFGQTLGFISIILFALMTGASSTTVRASLMAIIALGGRAQARRYDVTRALVCAGMAMVALNPAILVFDISFQLSFMSTLALIYVSPLVSDRLGFITEKYKLRDMVATTLATLIFTAPFIIYSMGQLSIISLISNIFVGPVIPHAMFLGFIALVLGFINPFIALPCAWITTAILSYVLHMTQFFGTLSFASVRIQTGVVTLVCMYTVYVLLLIILWRRKNVSLPSPS